MASKSKRLCAQHLCTQCGSIEVQEHRFGDQNARKEVTRSAEGRWKEDGIVKSNRHTGVILYVFDGVAACKSVLDAIDAAGYDVVSTNSSNQAFALLFIMHSAAAVVLDLQATEQSSFDFAQKLRAIQPDVPIVLRCCEHIGLLPSWVDGYLSARDPLEKLTSTLQMILDDQTIPDGSQEQVPRISV